MTNETKQSDLKPFVHGEEGTHAVCGKHNIGGKSVCCECSGKTDCSNDAPSSQEEHILGDFEEPAYIGGVDFGSLKSQWEKEIEDYFSIEQVGHSRLMPSTISEIKLFIQSLLKSQAPQIDHCSVKSCPECNLVAYEKGREEGALELRARIEVILAEEINLARQGEIGGITSRLTSACKKMYQLGYDDGKKDVPFIRSLLRSQASELVEKIEGMKCLVKTIKEFNGKWAITAEDKELVNAALQEVLDLIKKEYNL